MLAPETMLNERYRITYLLAEHPDLRLYRAIDTQQSLRVLIAELLQPGEAALNDLRTLASQLVGVSAPALLTLRDHLAYAGSYYMVADDPGGQDLARVARERGGPLPETEVLTVVERLLTTLDQLHGHQPPLLLGDLYPCDLWSSLDGGLFLTPFPLVRQVSGEHSSYLAPELLASSAELTTSSDVYSLGAVLYQLLTGWAPTPAAQRLAGTPLNAPRMLNTQISPLAEQLVLRALELKAVNRYQQAREMRSALDTVRLMAGRSLGASAPLDPARPPLSPPSESAPPVPVPASAAPPTPLPPAPPPSPSHQPQMAGVTGAPAPAAPRPRPGNGCLAAIIAALTLIALIICLVGAWVGWLVLNQGAALSLPGVPSAMNTPGSANQGGPPAAAVAPDPTIAALIDAGVPFSQTLQLSDAQVGAALYAPDGDLIAVGVGGTIELRDPTTLAVLYRLEGHSNPISALAFSPDGALLASGAQDDPQIRLWEVASGRQLAVLVGHDGWIRSLTFSPDGTLLASGATDRLIMLWDTTSRRTVQRLSGHTDLLGGLAFSPDGTMLASASRDGTVRLWQVVDGTQRADFAYTAPTNPQLGAPYWLTGLAFSPDGTTIAVGSTNGSVYLLAASDGTLQRELQGHFGWVVIRGVAFSPTGDMLASAGLDGTLRLWSPRTGAERAVMQQNGLRLLGLSWHPDGTALVVSSDTEGTLSIWDVARRTLSNRIILAQGAISSLAYSDTGASLATGSVNGSVQIHRLADERVIPLNGGAPTSQYLALLSDDELLALSDNGVVMRISLTNDAPSQVLQGLPGLGLSLDITPDRRLIAAGNDRGDVVIWDAATLNVKRTLSGLGGPVTALAFSRDGTQIVAATNSPADQPLVIVWEVQSGTRRSTFSGHRAPITALDMPAGQDVVASASSDGTLRIWQAASGEELTMQRVNDIQGWYSALAYSADGRLLITGTLDGMLECWEATSGKRLNAIDLSAHGAILGLAVSPQSTQVAVATRDGGTILLEPLPSQ